jgi:hypothetical protein
VQGYLFVEGDGDLALGNGLLTSFFEVARHFSSSQC